MSDVIEVMSGKIAKLTGKSQDAIAHVIEDAIEKSLEEFFEKNFEETELRACGDDVNEGDHHKARHGKQE